MLSVRDLYFRYNKGNILEDISFQLGRGEILALIGPNGSGKSTLLKCINNILKPYSGSIYIDNILLEKYKKIDLAKKIAYVPQHSSSFFPDTVFNTILMGRKPYLFWKAAKNDLEKVADVINKLDLGDIAMKDINELSGGQRQKVFIARALVQEADLILLDEPTSNLDIKHQLEIIDLLQSLSWKGLGVIITVHDLSLAGTVSDRIIILNEGKIFAYGGLEIITAENIEAVYGVKVTIKEHLGKCLVIPEQNTKKESGNVEFSGDCLCEKSV